MEALTKQCTNQSCSHNVMDAVWVRHVKVQVSHVKCFSLPLKQFLYQLNCSEHFALTCEIFLLQLEDPAIRWQMALYKDLPNRTEDSSDPEKTVERVLDIANVLFHLEQVREVFPIPLLLNLNESIHPFISLFSHCI